MSARRGLFALALLLASCATAPPMPEPTSTHPASPMAEPAPRAPMSDTLARAGEPR